MKKYQVKSIFGPTIQGEGSKAGTVVLFLRLAGCNRWSGREEDRAASICSFCDTDFRGGTPMTADEITAALRAKSETVLDVVISGGEPTLQLDEELVVALRKAHFRIHLETNGSSEINPTLYTLIHHVTMSPKQAWTETKLQRADDIKILFPWIREDITAHHFRMFPARRQFLQPVWGPTYESNLKATLETLYGLPGWSLSLQTHKLLGVE